VVDPGTATLLTLSRFLNVTPPAELSTAKLFAFPKSAIVGTLKHMLATVAANRKQHHLRQCCTRVRLPVADRDCHRNTVNRIRDFLSAQLKRICRRVELLHGKREALCSICPHPVLGGDGDRIGARCPRCWRSAQICAPIAVVDKRDALRQRPCFA
jgi:hypothetical protein